MGAETALRGTRNRENGRQFEELISIACKMYSRNGTAEIAKTPEPMRVAHSCGNGRFEAYYEKKAQPDYKGTLKGGRAFVMEAKHTDTGKLNQRAVTDEQAEQMDRHMALGAECFVLVSFGMRSFALIPWNIFRNMKEKWNRKYITPEDVEEYAVKVSGGIPDFLYSVKGGL